MSCNRHLCHLAIDDPLRLLSTSLRAAAGSSAEARLQTVDEVTNYGQDEEKDDDDNRDDNVAGHGGGCSGRERLMGSEVYVGFGVFG